MIDFNWYNELNKPPFSPDMWVFTPVWSLLYIMMIVSFLFYLFKSSVFSKTIGYVLFGIQLLLNLLWMPSFFILKNMGLALVLLILLDIIVYLTIKRFYKISAIAANFLIPYFIWILFATYLNAGFVLLNRF